jgi:hypothetical protein
MPKTAVLFILAFILAACGAPPPAPIKPETQKFTQPFTLRVLDSMDRPVTLAKVKLTAKKGHPQGPAEYETDKFGQIKIAWWPEVVNYTAGSQSRDEVFDLLSRVEYSIIKEGFFPAKGIIEVKARGRRLYDPNLQTLSREPILSLRTETVVLRRLGEVYGGNLTKMPPDSPLIKQLSAFFNDMVFVAPHLGVKFAWPTFVLDQKKLTMQFIWQGASWANLGHAPLIGQVTASSLLPLARAVGEELNQLPGVEKVALQVVSETTPPDDPHALPGKTTITMTAPLNAYSALAINQVSPDLFIQKNPPSITVKNPPRSASPKPTQSAGPNSPGNTGSETPQNAGPNASGNPAPTPPGSTDSEPPAASNPASPAETK